MLVEVCGEGDIKAFIKNNLALVVGVSLPLLLVVIFALASVLPGMFVSRPQYSMVFAANYYPNNGYLHYAIVNDQIYLSYNRVRRDYSSRPRLYLFDAEEQNVEEIQLNIPHGDVGEASDVDGERKFVTIEQHPLNDYRFDTRRIAPDGYEFMVDREGSRGFLFFGYHRRLLPVLAKNGNHVRLLDHDPYSYNYHFIGWVKRQEGAE